MQYHVFEFTVQAESGGEAGAGAQALADTLREADGVIEVIRRKDDLTTMDLGSIVQIFANSGATLAIAQGIAAWLRARRGVKLVVMQGGIKVEVAGIDPGAALRVIEMVREH